MNNLIENYNSSPAFKALFQIASNATPNFGLLGAVEQIIVTAYNNAQKKRVKLFFEQLGKGEIQLSESVIQEEEFLYFFTSTLKAVIRSRREEKIQFLSTLFLRTLETSSFEQSDLYEHYLSIVDELTLTELILLKMLYEVCKNESEDKIATEDWWIGFDDRALLELKKFNVVLNRDELSFIIAGLVKTGMLKPIYGWSAKSRVEISVSLLEKFILAVSPDSVFASTGYK